MCLAVPGKLIEVQAAEESAPGPTGVVDFQGTRVDVSLAFTPEAQQGDWLLVHAGFAINRLAEAEAREVWDLLQHDERFEGAAPAELGLPPGGDQS